VQDTTDMITVDEACSLIGGKSKPIDRSTFYRGVKAGRYTAPIHVSPNIVRVRRSKLLEDIERLVEGAA
jgi:predicted DNA-binding transcriptional regulator AlpA